MKIHTSIMLLVLLPAILVVSSNTYSAEGSLASCQKIKDRIDYYTRLRRSGGSSKTMEDWKQKRDHYKNKYSEKHCNQWRNDLK